MVNIYNIYSRNRCFTKTMQCVYIMIFAFTLSHISTIFLPRSPNKESYLCQSSYQFTRFCLNWQPVLVNERRRGRVVRALGCGAEGRRFESRSGQKTKKLSLSTQQRMGTWLTSGKVKGGERRGLGPAFHMPCPRHDGALTPHCPTAIRLRAPLPLPFYCQIATHYRPITA